MTTLTQIFLGLWIGFTIAGVVTATQGNVNEAKVFMCFIVPSFYAFVVSYVWKPAPKEANNEATDHLPPEDSV